MRSDPLGLLSSLNADELVKQYPAPYFIAVDDKRSVLHSYRVRLPTMVTVHVNQVDAVERSHGLTSQQGHYSSEIMHNFEPDFKIQTIGCASCDLCQIFAGLTPPQAPSLNKCH